MAKTITFIEINPGLGSLGFAAENAGMLRLGPMLLSNDVRSAYQTFHGAGSLELVNDTADIALTDISFSLFLDGKSADPDVVEAINAARDAIRRGGTAVFRVKWDIGLRLGCDPAGYVEAVSKVLPKYIVQAFVDTSTLQDVVVTSDLYIIASPPGKAVFEPVAKVQDSSLRAIHHVDLDSHVFSDDDPQQILSFLGFPEDFHRIAGSVPTIEDRIRECVSISRASVILETVASNIRG
ncbi:hypothetical protein G6L37_03495 [Agrobacterium rubi]|nr:hypothetical protein [Agrobacterium rubi]NTF24436.1 hypothetical protein [Agrobacterium rubi]